MQGMGRPLQLPLGFLSGTVLSRNCYEPIQKGFVIPGREYDWPEPIRTLEEINSKDKGGMIFSPSS